MPLIFAILLFLSAGLGVAQTSTGKVFFATPEACLAAPLDNSSIVYQPSFNNLLGWWTEKWELGTAQKVEGHNKTFCAEEQTVEGKQIIRWPKNNPFFTAGSRKADGRCGNEVYRLWEVSEPVFQPVVVVPPVAVAPASPAPPSHVCPECGDVTWAVNQPGVISKVENGTLVLGSVVLHSDLRLNLTFSFTEGVEEGRILAGDTVLAGGNAVDITSADGPEPGVYDIVAEGRDSDGHIVRCRVRITFVAPALPAPVLITVEKKKGRKFPIPCIPREKTWFGIGVPVLECAAIVGGVWAIWPVAEAFKHGAAVLVGLVL